MCCCLLFLFFEGGGGVVSSLGTSQFSELTVCLSELASRAKPRMLKFKLVSSLASP